MSWECEVRHWLIVYTKVDTCRVINYNTERHKRAINYSADVCYQYFILERDFCNQAGAIIHLEHRLKRVLGVNFIPGNSPLGAPMVLLCKQNVIVSMNVNFLYQLPVFIGVINRLI